MDHTPPDERLIIPANADLSDGTYQRLREAANKRCGTCKTQCWRLTKRQVGMAWQRWLQCVACGNTTGQALSQKEHPHWREYPLFDAKQYEQWHADRVAEHYDEKAKRSEQYAEWLKTSPEWAVLRKRVLARENYLCEACLERKATVVHHPMHYSHGVLPPAYHLTALCQPCHERMHTEGDEWGPPTPIDQLKADSGLHEEDFDGETR